MINLLTNAIKFTEKGLITLSASKKENSIKISIQDTGCGIKKEDLKKLFQRFAQIQRKPGGTGLGLAISKEIISAHKGNLWVESDPGKGSTFYFTLPTQQQRK